MGLSECVGVKRVRQQAFYFFFNFLINNNPSKKENKKQCHATSKPMEVTMNSRLSFSACPFISHRKLDFMISNKIEIAFGLFYFKIAKSLALNSSSFTMKSRKNVKHF